MCAPETSFEQSLLDSRIKVEDLLKAMDDAQRLLGKHGGKGALKAVRTQAMIVRRDLKDLRVGIIEELKKKEK